MCEHVLTCSDQGLTPLQGANKVLLLSLQVMARTTRGGGGRGGGRGGCGNSGRVGGRRRGASAPAIGTSGMAGTVGSSVIATGAAPTAAPVGPPPVGPPTAAMPAVAAPKAAPVGPPPAAAPVDVHAQHAADYEATALSNKGAIIVHDTVGEIHGQWVREVVQARSDLLSFPEFTDLATAAPLGRNPAGGDPVHTDPLDTHYRFKRDNPSAQANLNLHGHCEGNINVLKANRFLSRQKLAPVSKAKMEILMAMVKIDGEWPEDLALQFLIRNAADVEGEMPNATSITPLEFIWAPVLVYASHAKTSPGPDDMALIRRALLAANAKFSKQGAEAMAGFWGTFHLRHRLKVVGEAVKRTPVQKAFDIWESKQMLDDLEKQNFGADAMATYWQRHVEQGMLTPVQKGEPPDNFCFGLIDACFTAMRRFFNSSDCPIVRYAIECDLDGTTPLDSIYKYETAIKRAPSDEMAKWSIGGMIDFYQGGLLTSGELSSRQISGRGLPGGKGVIDLLVGKAEGGLALERKAREIGGFRSETLNAMKRWLGSHVSYRRDVGFRAGEKDTTWISTLPSPDQNYLSLFQDFCAIQESLAIPSDS